MGRRPRGAQTRRRTGLRPTRCSSIAHPSSGVAGSSCWSACTRRRKRALKTSWARGSASAWRGRGPWRVKPRRRRASLPRRGEIRRPSMGAPLGDRAARPEAVIRRRIVQAILQTALLACAKQRSGAGVELALVAQPRNPGLVVASHQNADPARRGPRHLGDKLGRASAGQQPDDRKVRPLRRILRLLVPPMQVIGLKVPLQVNCAAHPQTAGTPAPQWKPSAAVGITSSGA